MAMHLQRTNDTDNQFNHDANGNPITAQNNNNVDSGFNHDVDANNNVDPGFNHDVGNNASENSAENTTDADSTMMQTVTQSLLKMITT